MLSAPFARTRTGEAGVQLQLGDREVVARRRRRTRRCPPCPESPAAAAPIVPTRRRHSAAPTPRGSRPAAPPPGARGRSERLAAPPSTGGCAPIVTVSRGDGDDSTGRGRGAPDTHPRRPRPVARRQARDPWPACWPPASATVTGRRQAARHEHEAVVPELDAGAPAKRGPARRRRRGSARRGCRRPRPAGWRGQCGCVADVTA